MSHVLGTSRTRQIPIYVSPERHQHLSRTKTLHSFFRQLKSLTQEELMRFFVSHSLSLQFFDMALVDDGFSWLGSSASYNEARSMGQS